MKTVRMSKDHDYRPTEQVTVTYLAGREYSRVPEAHVVSIVGADAGEVVGETAEVDLATAQSGRSPRARG